MAQNDESNGNKNEGMKNGGIDEGQKIEEIKKPKRIKRKRKGENQSYWSEEEVGLNHALLQGANGRAKKLIDWKVFDAMCSLHCTAEEIAAHFDISIDTLEARIREEYGCSFPERFKIKCQTGKTSVRRKIYQQAMAGDRVLLKHIAEHWLGEAPKYDEMSPAAQLVKYLSQMRKQNKDDDE